MVPSQQLSSATPHISKEPVDITWILILFVPLAFGMLDLIFQSTVVTHPSLPSQLPLQSAGHPDSDALFIVAGAAPLSLRHTQILGHVILLPVPWPALQGEYAVLTQNPLRHLQVIGPPLIASIDVESGATVVE